jgi:outer membrane protein assembly factor BamB
MIQSGEEDGAPVLVVSALFRKTQENPMDSFGMDRPARCTWTCRILAVVCAAWMFNGTRAAAADPVALRARFVEGDKTYMEVREDTDATIRNTAAGSDAQEMKIRQVSGVFQEVISSSKDVTRLKRTFDRGSLFFSHPAFGELQFDSDAPTEEDNLYLKQMLGPQIGMHTVVALDANNKITSCTGMDAVAKEIDKVAGNANPFWAGNKSSITDEKHQKEFHDLQLLLLPDGKVGVGDTWNRTVEIEKARIRRTLVIELTCSLESIDEESGKKVATIHYESTGGKLTEPEGGGAGGSAKLESCSLSGTAAYDLEDGRLLRREEEAKSKVTLRRPGAAEDSPATVMEEETRLTAAMKSPVDRAREKAENLRQAKARMAKAKKEQAEQMAAAKTKSKAAGAKALDVVGTVMTRNSVQDTMPWPQWGGPHGDFKAIGAKGLADKWPVGGPKQLWSRDLGDGYSALSSDGDRLYTMYRIEEAEKNLHQDVVICMEAKTGKTVWEYKYDAPFTKEMVADYGHGPHASPLIVDDRLFTVGPMAKLHCFDRKSGRVLWYHDLVEELGASPMQRGYGASPFACEDKIILPAGGEEEGHGVVAFDQKDGHIAWKNQSFGATYSTPIMIELGGKDQLVVFSDKGLSGLDPASGDELWMQEHPGGANISTPVAGEDGVVFVSAAYGGGSRAVKLTQADGKTAAKELWYTKKMQIHHGNAIRIGDYVYGSSGSFGPAFFTAINVKTGEFGWKKRGISKATCLYADGKMIILDEDGNLYLTTVTPDYIEIHSKVQLCEKQSWTVPTLVGKTLFVRDRHTVRALDLG